MVSCRKLLLSFFVFAACCSATTTAFAPCPPPTTTITTVLKAAQKATNHHHRHKEQHHRIMDEIAQELEDLAEQEIQPHILHEKKRGMDGYYHESLVHKLRRTIHEHDMQYRHELKILQDSIQQLEQRLETTEHLLALEQDKPLVGKVQEVLYNRRRRREHAHRFKNFWSKVWNFFHFRARKE